MTDPLHFLFDFDGVLATQVDFAKVTADKYQLNENAVRSVFREHLPDCLRGTRDLIEVLSGKLRDIGWTKSPEDLFNAIYAGHALPNDELLSWIQDQRATAHCFHVATNQDRHRAAMVREEVEKLDCFAEFFCSCDLGAIKTEASYFDVVYRKLNAKWGNVPKQNIILIDDSVENLVVAEQFGFETHWFENVQSFLPFGSDALSGREFPKLKNERFTLTRMRLRDASSFSDILSEPDRYRFLSDSGPVDPYSALLKILANRKSFHLGKSLYWSIVDANNNFVGFIAVHGIQQPRVAMSFGVHPGLRRQGLATSAIQAVLNWSQLKTRTVTMATHLDNEASFRLLTKLKLEYLGIQQTPFGQRHMFQCPARNDNAVQ